MLHAMLLGQSRRVPTKVQVGLDVKGTKHCTGRLVRGLGHRSSRGHDDDS